MNPPQAVHSPGVGDPGLDGSDKRDDDGPAALVVKGESEQKDEGDARDAGKQGSGDWLADWTEKNADVMSKQCYEKITC